MRGTRRNTLFETVCPRIIPAYAGNTSNASNSASRWWDHPRVCGEHLGPPLAISVPEGSSPRMRGTQKLVVLGVARVGIIPAYAGNTSSQNLSSGSPWDHPRVCGEHHMPRIRKTSRQGSSPRMRGTQQVHAGNLSEGGIIPAYAGNTTLTPCEGSYFGDHPRVCGEHRRSLTRNVILSGSSPRMRGTPDIGTRIDSAAGIIPAYAGNTWRSDGIGLRS